MHDAGPAAEWASKAAVGQYLGIGDPRGSLVIPVALAWHVFIGDDTALPAIARGLRELLVWVKAQVIAEVHSCEAEYAFESKADMTVQWCHRDGGESPGPSLLSVVQQAQFRPGEGFIWVAGEAQLVREVRRHLRAERQISKARICAGVYWKKGAVAVHETVDDWLTEDRCAGDEG